MRFAADVVRWFTDPSHWQGVDGVPNRMAEHVAMSGASLLAAALVAVPLGLVLGHRGGAGAVAINVSNVGRAIPSFALLVIAAQVIGIGAGPAFVALVALSVPPMVTGSYVGVRTVDAEVVEAARGMGMTGRQLLWQVELPVALPLVLGAVRTAAVQVVATATLAAVVAWGGLGRFIVDGLARRDFVATTAGALVVAALAVTTELVLAAVARRCVSPGLQAGPAGQNGQRSPSRSRRRSSP